jgi:hypothetical protein
MSTIMIEIVATTAAHHPGRIHVDSAHAGKAPLLHLATDEARHLTEVVV